MLTTTGIIIMTAYTVGMLYSIVNDTTRKPSQRIGKILLSVGEGILLYTASIWFLVLSLSMIALSVAAIYASTDAKEFLRWELARLAASGGKPLSVNATVAMTAGVTAVGVVVLYWVMATWGVA
jgi:uncharacterized protein (DUF58 family)